MNKRILAALLAAAFAPAFAQSGLTDLGPTFGGGTSSTAFGVSADGTVVVGAVSTDSGSIGFRWENGGVTNIGASGDWLSALAVSADGQTVVGSFLSGSNTRAFRWTSADGVVVDLGTLGGNASTANGVSANGAVVVGEAQDGAFNTRAFR